MAAVDRVIVGASGSPGSLRALRYAEGLARGHHAALLPVIAWAPPGGDRGRCQPAGYLRQVSQDQACQRLRDALISVWGKLPDDPRAEPHVERGAAGGSWSALPAARVMCWSWAPGGAARWPGWPRAR